MKFLFWLIVLLLAALGVAAVVDYTGAYDVPMIEVSKEGKETAIAPIAEPEPVVEEIVEIEEDVVEEIVDVVEETADDAASDVEEAIDGMMAE